ncbi:restriction endonuclease subunit S [Chryseobacterium sp. NEB161]|nr:restriction endonuclease subunit S [Chryseobacterium sp. NEB161]
MEEFKLSDNVDSNRVFIVRRSELEERFDVEFAFNREKLLHKFQFPLKKIKNYFIVKDGDHDKLPERELRDGTNGKRYLRAQDIKNGKIVSDKPVFVSKEYFDKIKRCQIYPGDLLISIMASLGLNAIVPNDFEISVANRAVGILRSKDTDILITHYLQVLLNTPIGFSLFDIHKKGGIQQRLNLNDIANVFIPLPPKDIQKKIVEIYSNAYIQKQQKEAEAKALLDSIDDYLLGELGITLPSEDDEESNLLLAAEPKSSYGNSEVFELDKENLLVKKGRLFLTHFSEIEGRRWDVFEVVNRSKKIEGGIYPNKKLKQIASLVKGQSITSDKIIGGKYPVIAGGQTSPYNHNQFNFEGDIITISASGAYSGYVWYHDYPIFASDCTVVFAKNENEISTTFLSEILKLKQQEIYNLQQGAGQPHVYAKDLAMLNIPVPSMSKQTEIIQHISSIRSKSEQLFEEAKNTLENAKSNVERMILGQLMA